MLVCMNRATRPHTPTQAMLEQAMGPGGVLPAPGQPLVNLNSGNDNIQVRVRRGVHGAL